MKKDKKKEINSKSILQFLKYSSKPLHFNEFVTNFRATKQEKKEIRTILRQQVKSGKLFLTNKRYSFLDNLPTCIGILEMHRGGSNFVLQPDNDIFVRSCNLGDAWNGDEVEVVLISCSRQRSEGKVVRIVRRNLFKIAVRVEGLLGGGLIRLSPLDWRLKVLFAANPDGIFPPPSRGDVLLIEAGEKIAKGLWQAEIIRHLGDELDERVQEQIVKASQRVPLDFPSAVIEQVKKLSSEPNERDFEGRKDFRYLPFVTIDGETAKDFDDAVFVEKTEDGFVLYVAIADVAHYVQPKSALDEEAFSRGNSWYFPCSVEPMLPTALSNGLCSLNPEKDRLVMVARLFFTVDGGFRRSEFFEGIIKSVARLTYGQVAALFEENEADLQENLPVNLEEKRQFFYDLLIPAKELAKCLRQKRQERGGIDFDLPEMQAEVDENGQVISLFHAKRFFSHQLIEEFMLAANEAVASFLTEKNAPCLYRVHPEPDANRLRNLFVLLRRSQNPLIENLPELVTSQALHALLRAASGSEMEFLINRLLLRSMMQASYTPENSGHFGLGLSCYCHFTSPIRRYADLIVHRSLKAILHGNCFEISQNRLVEIAAEINSTERRAMLAEREINRRCAVLYLRQHMGERFFGVISSFADFGFWVELDGLAVEGLVGLNSLRDDRYVFLQKEQIVIGECKGRKFQLGQRVQVVLKSASLKFLEIELELNEFCRKKKKSIKIKH